MKMLLRLALAATLLAIGIHVYLSVHYYDVNFGGALGDSFCNINAKFDCDSVTASRFSSLFGVPIATFGAFTNLLLAFLLLTLMFRLTEVPDRVKRIALWLSAVVASASLVMLGVSLMFMQTYCILCMTTYALSFLTVFFIYRIQEGSPLPHLGADIKALYGSSKTYGVLLLLVPVASYLVHMAKLSEYNLTNVNQLVTNYHNQWASNSPKEFNAAPSLTKGPEQNTAVITVQEFADFKCPHCKNTASPLKTFANSHPEVRFEFYVFPLDGTCNEAIKSHSSGLNCFLAKSVYCANKQDKGWEMHDQLFKIQSLINRIGSLGELESKVQEQATTLNLNWGQLKECVEQTETNDAISAQAKLGENIGIQGTPAIFVNGRKLTSPPRLLIKLLDRIYTNVKGAN